MNDTSAHTTEEREGFVSSMGTGPLTRPRPIRPPLIPRTPLYWLVAVTGAIILGVAIWVVSANTSTITVPNLVGTGSGEAATLLRREGLDLKVTSQRFSSRPEGEILEQSPKRGAKLRHGGSVGVVVSAGTEDFVMPDVVGDGLALAKGTLESRGLQVRVELQPSQQPSDTVLSSNPAPGAAVRTGDVVSLTVSAKSSTAGILLPFDMSALVVVIDPAITPSGQTDASGNVARRLKSLLEASGARVIVTRSVTDTRSVTAKSRRTAALETSCTAAIGLDVVSRDKAGIVVVRNTAGSPSLAQAKARLSSTIATELVATSLSSTERIVADDPILGQLSVPWVRLELGSSGAREDLGKFRDPRWSDTVARDIYRSIGSIFAEKGGT